MTQAPKHIPVMLNEVLSSMKPQKGETYVDATFGNGGYTQALLDSSDCKVISIDRDPNVLPRAKELQEKYGNRFEFVQGRFGDLEVLLADREINGFVFDIGVSSMQLDEAQRGFSFSKEAPLDMRMSCSGLSAADLVNDLEEKELADLIYKYGEEVKSRHISKKIVEYRKTKRIESTTELADIIRSVVKKTKDVDPATKTFQALRIAVNDELGELERGLESATKLLKSDGRLVVVTFHSLEDRIVKYFFKEKAGRNPNVSRYMPEIKSDVETDFKDVSKVIHPTKNEEINNRRARSAKLRFAVKK
ncbi:MAG: 16S rRNA (cytosine(1402)-N(4))-methyltransferase RsmH [Alphaproteobacteria bacterium]